MEQDKLKIIGRAARKFMGCANRLVDASKDLAQHESGSRGRAKTLARWKKADMEYDAAYQALDRVVDELG